MCFRAIPVALAVAFVWPSASVAALIVNPARPITHQVSVQLIETAPSSGAPPAKVFGSGSQRAAIEAAIDTIWAQAGIDIAFLPSVVRYDDTFAYQGNGDGGARPTNDLYTIMSNAVADGVVNSDPSVINMFFVNIVPGFSYAGKNSANGIGSIGNDGIAQFVGDNLLGFQSGREVISKVVAHEIGHNLGLKHAPAGQANLMSPSGTSAQLTDGQISAVFQTSQRNDATAFIPAGGTGFPQIASSELLGDYNSNGVVDAADYVIWRHTQGSSTVLDGDGDGNLVVDAADYTLWRSRFGGRISVGGSAGPPGGLEGTPEPTTLVNLAAGLVWLAFHATKVRTIRAAKIQPPYIFQKF